MASKKPEKRRVATEQAKRTLSLEEIRVQAEPVIREVFERFARENLFPKWWPKWLPVSKIRFAIEREDAFGWELMQWEMGPVRALVSRDRVKDNFSLVFYPSVSPEVAAALKDEIQGRIQHLLE